MQSNIGAIYFKSGVCQEIDRVDINTRRGFRKETIKKQDHVQGRIKISKLGRVQEEEKGLLHRS